MPAEPEPTKGYNDNTHSINAPIQQTMTKRKAESMMAVKCFCILL